MAMPETDLKPIIDLKVYALPLDQNPAAVYLASLSSETGRRSQRQALSKIAEILGYPDMLAADWAALRFQHTTAIRTRLIEQYAPATVNRILSALKGALKNAWRLGHLSADDYQRAIDLDPVNGSRLPAGRAVTMGELGAILANCENDPGPAGVRDAAMIALGYICGLRRAEIIGLDLSDYHQAAGEMRIMGKRRKERLAYPTNGAAAALADWLLIRGNEPGPLFYPINKNGRLYPKRLTAASYFMILQKRAAAAGVERLTPHDLRRSCAGDMLDSGVDIATVAKLLGHESTTTTMRYDRRGETAKRKAADLLHVPYHRRKK